MAQGHSQDLVGAHNKSALALIGSVHAIWSTLTDMFSARADSHVLYSSSAPCPGAILRIFLEPMTNLHVHFMHTVFALSYWLVLLEKLCAKTETPFLYSDSFPCTRATDRALGMVKGRSTGTWLETMEKVQVRMVQIKCLKQAHGGQASLVHPHFSMTRGILRPSVLPIVKLQASLACLGQSVILAEVLPAQPLWLRRVRAGNQSEEQRWGITSKHATHPCLGNSQ